MGSHTSDHDPTSPPRSNLVRSILNGRHPSLFFPTTDYTVAFFLSRRLLRRAAAVQTGWPGCPVQWRHHRRTRTAQFHPDLRYYRSNTTHRQNRATGKSSHHRSGRRWSGQRDAAAARSMASHRWRRPTGAEFRVSGGGVPDSTRRHSSSLMATVRRMQPAPVSAPRSSGWCPRPSASAWRHAPWAPWSQGHPHHHASAAKRWPTTLSLSHHCARPWWRLPTISASTRGSEGMAPKFYRRAGGTRSERKVRTAGGLARNEVSFQGGRCNELLFRFELPSKARDLATGPTRRILTVGVHKRGNEGSGPTVHLSATSFVRAWGTEHGPHMSFQASRDIAR
jgi:hypothetical protein